MLQVQPLKVLLQNMFVQLSGVFNFEDKLSDLVIKEKGSSSGRKGWAQTGFLVNI